MSGTPGDASYTERPLLVPSHHAPHAALLLSPQLLECQPRTVIRPRRTRSTVRLSQCPTNPHHAYPNASQRNTSYRAHLPTVAPSSPMRQR